MLLQFSVENFLSFKEKAVLSLEPIKDKDHPENIIKKGDYKSVNVIASYGANASGKTNFFKAITIALVMIRSSNVRQINDQLPITPFKFNDGVLGNSRFEFQFVASDNKKYIYGFEANNNCICKEYLYRFSSKKPAKIFERNGDEYEFTAREKNSLMPLTQMNTPNKLFIATATQWNAQSTKIPYEWLSSAMDTYSDLGQGFQNSPLLYQGAKGVENIRFAEKLLSEADINISKIDIKIKKMPINPNLMPFMPGLIVNGQLIQPHEQTEMEVTTFHDIVDSSNQTVKQYSLKLPEESQGTQLLFMFSPVLKDVLDNGKTIMIDEIDKSLHPAVVKYIVNLFRNKEVNKKGAQLIIITHNTSLLSLQTFRRDQIYFIDKENSTGMSNIYSMKNYTVRKGENIEKRYILGRYGAVPEIKGGDIL